MNGLVALSSPTAYLDLVSLHSNIAPLGLLLGLVWSGVSRAEEPLFPESTPPGPQVELLTMGPGDSLFSRYGHAALMVHRPNGSNRVYNYGYTNFTSPTLVWDFLRGGARFWVARQDYRATIWDYEREDRTLYRQRLQLEPRAHRRLAGLLRRGIRVQNRYYTYHHFDDNCSTRLRDLLDTATDGQLSRALRGRPGPEQSLRDLVRQGFSDQLPLLLVVDILLGRTLDRKLDAWTAAFLPRELRRSVQAIRLDGVQLAGQAEVVHQRSGPPPGGDTGAAVKLGWLLAGLAALAGLVMLLFIRRVSRWAGLSLLLLAVFSGTVGLAVWVVAAVATIPELRLNELVLSLWPLDLGLLWLAGRWLRGRLWAGRLARAYAVARVATLGLVAVGHAAGLLIQRPLAWPVFAAAVAIPVLFSVRCLPSKRDLDGDGGSVVEREEENDGNQAPDTTGPLS